MASSIPTHPANPAGHSHVPLPKPLPSGTGMAGHDVNDLTGELPEQSTFMTVVSLVQKFALPLFLGTGAIALFVITAMAAPPLTVPFLLLTGASLLTVAGIIGFTNVLTADAEKETRIRNLENELEKAKKEKDKTPSLDVLKREVKEITQELAPKVKRINELTTLKAASPLNQNQQEELDQLEEEVQKLRMDRDRKNRWIAELETKQTPPPVATASLTPV